MAGEETKADAPPIASEPVSELTAEPAPKRRGSWKTRYERAVERYEGFNGPWADVGEGVCTCGVERRLYSPVARPDVRLCAPCTQKGALAAIPNDSRGDD